MPLKENNEIILEWKQLMWLGVCVCVCVKCSQCWLSESWARINGRYSRRRSNNSISHGFDLVDLYTIYENIMTLTRSFIHFVSIHSWALLPMFKIAFHLRPVSASVTHAAYERSHISIFATTNFAKLSLRASISFTFAVRVFRFGLSNFFFRRNRNPYSFVFFIRHKPKQILFVYRPIVAVLLDVQYWFQLSKENE